MIYYVSSDVGTMRVDTPGNDLLRSLREADLARLHKRYLTDANLCWVCEAFELADQYGLPPPDWVLDGLRPLVREVVKISARIRRFPEEGLKGDEHTKILRALGLIRGRGKRSALGEFLAIATEEEMFWSVLPGAFCAPLRLSLSMTVIGRWVGLQRSWKRLMRPSRGSSAWICQRSSGRQDSTSNA